MLDPAQGLKRKLLLTACKKFVGKAKLQRAVHRAAQITHVFRRRFGHGVKRL